MLLKSAEIALLQAQKNGRHRIEFYRDEPIVALKKGVCSTYVGNNLKGNCKERSPAFYASISEPYGVNFDHHMDLLFVDRSNHQIKKVHNDRIYTVVYVDMAVTEALPRPQGCANLAELQFMWVKYI